MREPQRTRSPRRRSADLGLCYGVVSRPRHRAHGTVRRPFHTSVASSTSCVFFVSFVSFVVNALFVVTPCSSALKPGTVRRGSTRAPRTLGARSRRDSLHASGPHGADGSTAQSNWASEVRRRRGPRSVPTYDCPHGSSSNRRTRAKTNGIIRTHLMSRRLLSRVCVTMYFTATAGLF